MPRTKSVRINSEKDFRQTLADALRDAARNPSIDKYKPHDKQIRFHKSMSHGRQFLGGNRAGKTVGGATETIWFATGRHPFKKLPWKPPLRLRVVTVDLNEGLEKIVLPEIKRWINKTDLIEGSWEKSYDKQLRTLTLNNGSFIEFMTYEQDVEKFAGTSRHGIWFDEEPPKEIYKECMLRLLDVGGMWWMTMTPVEGMTWTFEEIYESQNPNIEVFEVDMDDNPYLSEEGKAVVLAGLSEDELKARKHGQYVSRGGLIYKDFDFDVCVINPLRPPIDWLWIACMDHGYRNPTAWLWLAISEDGRVIVFDELYNREKLVYENATEVIQKEIEHGKPVSYRVGDPSIRNTDPITGTSVQIEYVENGIPIVPGNNDVRAGIDAVKKLMVQRRLYVAANCVNLLWEFKRYRWATWERRATEDQKNRKEEPQKKDDHACDALRYGIASRPELQIVGARVPTRAQIASVEASVANDPEKGLIDKELTSVSKKETYDAILGEDW